MLLLTPGFLSCYYCYYLIPLEIILFISELSLEVLSCYLRMLFFFFAISNSTWMRYNSNTLSLSNSVLLPHSKHVNDCYEFCKNGRKVLKKKSAATKANEYVMLPIHCHLDSQLRISSQHSSSIGHAHKQAWVFLQVCICSYCISQKGLPLSGVGEGDEKGDWILLSLLFLNLEGKKEGFAIWIIPLPSQEIFLFGDSNKNIFLNE